jgi:hypothetical protein
VSRIIILGIAILAVLAILLPKHQPWLDHRDGLTTGNPYAYSVVECPPHDDICLGA